jgi:hypothetical protein
MKSLIKRDDTPDFKIKIKKIIRWKSRIIGLIFLILSLFFFLLAFQTRYILFEIVSVLCLFFGAALTLLNVERSVKMKTCNTILLSATSAFWQIVEHLKIQGTISYLPPTPKYNKVRIFINPEANPSLPLKIIKSRGISLVKDTILPAFGAEIVNFYQNHLGNLNEIELSSFLDQLPRILTDELEIADKVEINTTQNEITFIIKGYEVGNFCARSVSDNFCERFPCPLISSIGESLAILTKRIIFYSGCKFHPPSSTSKVKFLMGPLPHIAD